MLVSVEVPDLIAHSLRLDGPQSNRRALEMLALEGYRSGELSRGQVSEMLGMEFNETEKFVKDLGALLQYTADDFERDAATRRNKSSRTRRSKLIAMRPPLQLPQQAACSQQPERVLGLLGPARNCPFSP